mgnify:CR=1 FL=1
MPVKILLPALSPTMTEGTLVKWLKKEGEEINSGDIVAEVETDKATMEIEAIEDGKLGRILIAEGTEAVPINTPIALILEEGEDDSALDTILTSEADAASPKPVDVSNVELPKSDPTAEKPITAPDAVKSGVRIFASPLAKRMARQAGLDLAQILGSGPKGRIVKADIESALLRKKEGASPTQATSATVPEVLPSVTATPVANSNMRKVIANRLTESKQTIPHFYLSIDCIIDNLLEVRSDLNNRSTIYKLSINDFVIRASALALKKVPAANASWTDDATILHGQVDISVAVAVEGGLITPIIFNASGKGLSEISNEMVELAQRARDGRLKPEEYQGGSFSISNLGMHGVKEFSAVINPPQSGILAVGAGEQRPIVDNGALAIATVMTCTLSCDHRVIDGAIGAEWLAAFKGLIEGPLTMLL